MERTGTLILVRHGESTANADGTFTGSRDVDLSALGVQQSHHAAALMTAAGLVPDVVMTSRMLRARRTAEAILSDLPDVRPPVIKSWRLNERDYGLLMGMPKTAVRQRFGPERFQSWRRTMHGRPPPMPVQEREDLGLVPLDEDPMDPQPPDAPGEGESLHDVVLRVRPLWEERILEQLHAGLTVLVIAHGNSLRALSSIIDHLTDAELEELNLPTAQPIVYRLAPDTAPAPRGGRYLDPDTAVPAAIRIRFEGGT
jgi:2,3-bisphosphoglycerate-dependent phosphoglycerate mutase